MSQACFIDVEANIDLALVRVCCLIPLARMLCEAASLNWMAIIVVTPEESKPFRLDVNVT